ncbi:bifunctional 4-hydroxy-2-oxoglutarate aldolase/2-dehydro-3-deoxy-phosphogluconate aldolase [Salipaludibacillus aurantiacus]|uniref:2-dehydro-3-deoxyphosphogluconate aldolase / (4S)-4-hydroxy-2-oxoglutarate aldolase n=1 Tax=Salipaludibacillus aurantiacus TaxID=1601833 RepID=A0A1H9UAT2_9BACI|nr:bifunctional 4-hydroxy-2-oxoglutarate aldolase/2-dehydro-3-deoxy-phosphogluconate aldolase [Salipaludibacillus aurantiacus]SES06442.1 2-dehydro-3-deoxyphosphogluconate aldolase / (4S)-4-hydroxy-2-oxoglutarate aldolase [Salipaludibacillus aurantiacus]
MNRSTLEHLESSPVIAVLRKPPEEKIFHITEALIQGGITNLELTMQGPESLRLLEEINKRYSSDAWIGAGTVIDESTAASAIIAGASFIFSPNCSPDVIKTAKRHQVISIPGILTPTEMVTAVEAGADAVKIFPASAFGPRYIKELKGPFPDIPMIPTGGISEENIAEYMKAGVIACGMGSSLIDKQSIENGYYEELTNRAVRIMKAVR